MNGQIQDAYASPGPVCPGNWMAVLDLQDAYFHIPVLQAHRRYLWFTVGWEHFQFVVLPSGLSLPLWCSQK